MIIYKSSDVKLSWEHFQDGEGHTHGVPKTCGYVKEELGQCCISAMSLVLEIAGRDRTRSSIKGYGLFRL